jgi:pimeloyl-ACP methyl ester carboxylesterase
MPFVDSGGLSLFYSESGAGLPVLWHTGGCGDGTMWERAGYISGLPGYRHLMFDHRGHGRSQAPAGTEGHHMDRYVEDVIAVLDDAGAERAVFVGYSMGACVGYAVAAAHPGRLAGLVGLDSVPAHEEQAAALREAAAEVLAKGTASIIAGIAASESGPAPGWLLDHLSATRAEAFAGSYEAMATEPAFWANAPHLTAPALLLLAVGEGEDDWWTLGEEAAAVMPDATAVMLPGLGHLQAFWRTDVSLPPIQRFLARASSV